MNTNKRKERNRLVMKYPAAWHGDMWREAMAVGNGKIGGLVYGGVYKEIIAINDARLWTHINTPQMPDTSYLLPKMRELLAQNKPIEAENLYRDEFAKLGYDPSFGKPLPLCDIEIIQSSNKGFKNYERILDMENAEAEVVWKDADSHYSRRFFVSRADDAAYLLLTSDNGKINADVTLKIHDEETLNGEEPPENIECTVNCEYIMFSATKDGKDFGAVMRVKHNGSAECKDGKIFISDADYITACTKFFIYGDRNDKIPELKAQLQSQSIDYYAALKEHRALHCPLFMKTRLELSQADSNKSNEELLLDAYGGEASAEFVEKLWSFGRYLLICASDPDGLPCHLYGIWTGGYNVWWAFNMFNVNIEMMYWQALPGGMEQMLVPIFNYLDDKMEDFRENARKLYACRGINIPSVSTPESGLYKCLLPHILHWTGAAAWIAQFYFDYYLYTRDVKFLRERGIPFMYEVALFYEDFLFTEDKGDGKNTYVFSPSNSPENTPGNIKSQLGRECEVTVNATMDIALVKELLTNLITASEITGEHSKSIDMWKEMLIKLPNYELNEYGAVKEWTHPYYTDNYEHRHLSHIYPVFPGYEISRDDALYPAFKKAVELRETVGLKDQSGWSLAYMANIYARMGEGEKALECLDYLTRSVVLPNFFTVHNDWRRMGVAVCGDNRVAPIQLDAVMGLTASINEMLVFSTPDEIYLFNALPMRFKCGSAVSVYTRTASEIDLEWNEKSAVVKIRQHSADVKIKLVLPHNMRFESENTNSIDVELKMGECYKYNILKG